MNLLQQRHSFTCQKSSGLAGSSTAASPPSTHRSHCLPVYWVQQGSPASPAQCRAPRPGCSSCRQRDTDRSLHKGVCFLSDPGSVSGKHCWPGHRAPRKWGWDKLFLRSPLLCSDLLMASSRAHFPLSEIPLMFLALLPIQWLSLWLVLLSHG